MHLMETEAGAVVYTLNDITIDQLGYLMKPWMSDDEKQAEGPLNSLSTPVRRGMRLSPGIWDAGGRWTSSRYPEKG